MPETDPTNPPARTTRRAPVGRGAGFAGLVRLRPGAGAALAATALLAATAIAARAEEIECGCLAHRLERAENGRLMLLGAPGEGRGGDFDPASGRDHRNFPPDPLVEYRGMVLTLQFADLASGRFSGVQRLTVA